MNSQKTRALTAIATTNFLVMLALMPVTAVLPVIAANFQVDVTTASWLITAFLLTLTSSLLIAGRVGDLYGPRQVFLVGAIVYTVSGTACAFAQQIGVLIALRAVQGFGAAMISGNSLAIITHNFNPRERGTAIGIGATFASLGSAVGVLISTYLAQYVDWQLIFLLTFPVGLIGVVAAWRLEVNYKPSVLPRVDFLGTLLIAATLVSFSLMLSHLHSGEASYATDFRYHGAMLSLTALFALLFIMAERHAPQPIVDLKYLRNGPFAWSVVANETLHMTMMATSFLLPFLMANGRGFSTMDTAVVILAIQVTNFSSAPISGLIFDRTRWRLLPTLALGLVGASLLTTAIWAPSIPLYGLVLVGLAIGAGLGFFQTPNNTIIMGTVPPELRGFAAGMVETSRQLGHTLGVGISGAVLSIALAGAAHHGTVQSASYVAGFQQAVLAAGAMVFVGVLASLAQARSPSQGEERPALAKAV